LAAAARLGVGCGGLDERQLNQQGSRAAALLCAVGSVFLPTAFS